MKIIGCQHNLRMFCWTLKARDTDCLELNLSLKASAACNHLKRIWWCHAGNLPSFHHRNLIQCPHSGKILDETMLISHKVCVYKMIWSETHCSLRCQQESLIRIWRCHCNNVMKTGAENTGLDCDQAGTRLITQCWGRPLLYTVHTTVHCTDTSLAGTMLPQLLSARATELELGLTSPQLSQLPAAAANALTLQLLVQTGVMCPTLRWWWYCDTWSEDCKYYHQHLSHDDE